MKKFLTLMLTLVVALTACLGLTACGDKDKSDVDYIKEKGNLVVGITVYEPMDYLDENGEWTGFDAEIANKLGEKLGVNVQFVIIKWANKVAELKSKNIDCIWNGMTATAELEENIDLTASYAENRQVAVIRKTDAASINSVDTVKNARIAVEKGSAGDKVAIDTLAATNVNKVEAQVNALMEVKSLTSDVAIIDYTMAKSVVGKGDYESLMIVDPEVVSFAREVFAVGVRTDSNLKAEIENLFNELYKSGELQILASKYGVILNEETFASLN